MSNSFIPISAPTPNQGALVMARNNSSTKEGSITASLTPQELQSRGRVILLEANRKAREAGQPSATKSRKPKKGNRD